MKNFRSELIFSIKQEKEITRLSTESQAMKKLVQRKDNALDGERKRVQKLREQSDRYDLLIAEKQRELTKLNRQFSNSHFNLVMNIRSCKLKNQPLLVIGNCLCLEILFKKSCFDKCCELCSRIYRLGFLLT